MATKTAMKYTSPNNITQFDLHHNRNRVARDLYVAPYRGVDPSAPYLGSIPADRPPDDAPRDERIAWRYARDQQISAVEAVELACYARAADRLLAVLPADCQSIEMQGIGLDYRSMVPASNAIGRQFQMPVLSSARLNWSMGVGKMFTALTAIEHFVAREILPVVEFSSTIDYRAVEAGGDESSRLHMLSQREIMVQAAANAVLGRFLATHGGILRECIDDVFAGVAEIIGVGY